MNYFTLFVFIVVFTLIFTYFFKKFRNSKFLIPAVILAIVAFLLGSVSIFYPNKYLEASAQALVLVSGLIAYCGVQTKKEDRITLFVFIVSFVLVQIIGYAFDLGGLQLVMLHTEGHGFAFGSILLPGAIAMIFAVVYGKYGKTKILK